MLFSTVTRRYLEQQGFASATFVCNGRPINPNENLKSLGLEDGARIEVQNAKNADLSGNATIEVHIFDRNGSMGVRGYSVKPYTTCGSLIRSLRCQLGETRSIHIYCEREEMAVESIIADKPKLMAICN